ncbi:hypothetical protein D3C87_2200670 [compost metagenome]
MRISVEAFSTIEWTSSTTGSSRRSLTTPANALSAAGVKTLVSSLAVTTTEIG